MHNNLVIVESPAKATTIEKFLGSDYKVMSSHGHIRDLRSHELSIDEKTLTPFYEIPADKADVVKKLRDAAKRAHTVWLASDEDREGEAISWHLCEVLGLDASATNRIVFHEITKPAILSALESPRRIDMNLVHAQQARRVLDRLVGFKLSPVLWRKVKPSLSAGRVQSVTVRLIVEREREVRSFEAQPYFRVTATFSVGDSTEPVRAELDHRFATREDAVAFLKSCEGATFTVSSVTKKPLRRSPSPPFTTSTLQQDAARKLGLSVSQTMMVAQRLYESGYITYMRTDSLNLSRLFVGAAKSELTTLYGEEYCRSRVYHTHSKGAQEAHEAIRPTAISRHTIDGTAQERRLYDLIWKRTAASQMADAQIEKTVVTIGCSGSEHNFVANGEVVLFDGFLKVYREATGDDDRGDEKAAILPPIVEGDSMHRLEIASTERFTQGPSRYTEASLVHKLEELGIGRPSTYAPTISTIQQRGYVVRTDKKGTERAFVVDTLTDRGIRTKHKTEVVGHEKGKLAPTDIGMVVNDFLMANFPAIMDYGFTAKVEQQFDRIAEGAEAWDAMVSEFDDSFEPAVEAVMNARSEHRVGERILGDDPKTGRRVSVKIGRYGPLAQIGAATDDDKPLFAHLPSDKSIETISLEEALELFRLPRTVGEYEGKAVTIGSGRYGPYVQHDGKYTSLPKDCDPLTVSLDDAITLIERHREEETKRHLKRFEQDATLEILDGRYGPYICKGGENYRIPKTMHSKAATLTYEQCLEIIAAAPTKKKRPSARRKK